MEAICDEADRLEEKHKLEALLYAIKHGHQFSPFNYKCVCGMSDRDYGLSQELCPRLKEFIEAVADAYVECRDLDRCIKVIGHEFKYYNPQQVWDYFDLKPHHLIRIANR